jgi:hypothetical protein
MLLPVSADDLGHTVYLLLRRVMGAYVIFSARVGESVSQD